MNKKRSATDTWRDRVILERVSVIRQPLPEPTLDLFSVEKAALQESPPSAGWLAWRQHVPEDTSGRGNQGCLVYIARNNVSYITNHSFMWHLSLRRCHRRGGWEHCHREQLGLAVSSPGISGRRRVLIVVVHAHRTKYMN